MYLNQLTIIGFIGSEAEVHYTTSGTLVATLSVATRTSTPPPDRAARAGIALYQRS